MKQTIRLTALCTTLCILLLCLTSCWTKITPWDSYSETLVEQYEEIQSLERSSGNTPGMWIYVYGEGFDIDAMTDISRELVHYITSEEGYSDMVDYYTRTITPSDRFSAICVYFYIETADRYIALMECEQDSAFSEDDIDNLRGFLTGHLWGDAVGQSVSIDMR